VVKTGSGYVGQVPYKLQNRKKKYQCIPNQMPVEQLKVGPKNAKLKPGNLVPGIATVKSLGIKKCYQELALLGPCF